MQGRPAVLEVSKASMGFAAAHFSVVGGHSETLHGHNYRVGLRAHGCVQPDGAMVDFAALKDAVHAECAALDHRMLLPTQSRYVHVETHDDGHVTVREGARRFLFPRGDVSLLPVPDTTCECLAGHLLERVRARLGELAVRLEVTVEETPGQAATVAEPAAPGTRQPPRDPAL